MSAGKLCTDATSCTIMAIGCETTERSRSSNVQMISRRECFTSCDLSRRQRGRQPRPRAMRYFISCGSSHCKAPSSPLLIPHVVARHHHSTCRNPAPHPSSRPIHRVSTGNGGSLRRSHQWCQHTSYSSITTLEISYSCCSPRAIWCSNRDTRPEVHIIPAILPAHQSTQPQSYFLASSPPP